jgi:hypothetical protein
MAFIIHYQRFSWETLDYRMMIWSLLGAAILFVRSTERNVGKLTRHPLVFLSFDLPPHVSSVGEIPREIPR